MSSRLETLLKLLCLFCVLAGGLLIILSLGRPAKAIQASYSGLVVSSHSIFSLSVSPTPMIITATHDPDLYKQPFGNYPTKDNPEDDWIRCAPDAPFIMPTSGLIGYMWDDSFRPSHRHTGLDIFGGQGAGVTPVVAAYPGYLSRPRGWVAAVIVRVPADPLQPERQIWLYYTHMADRFGNSYISSEFPQGTSEKYITIGTFIGYQGNYTGDASPAGVHLHFSIVLSDTDGNFLNELEIKNTLDPSPYFGIPLNGKTAPDEMVVCGNAGN